MCIARNSRCALPALPSGVCEDHSHVEYGDMAVTMRISFMWNMMSLGSHCEDHICVECDETQQSISKSCPCGM
jgi:hypothetical protein